MLDMFSPRQPIPASSRLAAAVQLRAVQPADRRAAQVPPPSPLRDGGQQGSGKGPGGRTPSRSGLLNRCILTFVSCDIFRQSCITLWYLITLLHVSTSCEIPPFFRLSRIFRGKIIQSFARKLFCNLSDLSRDPPQRPKPYVENN